MAAVIVPAMLPPPMPFKLFVLAAGVAGMSARTFAWAIGDRPRRALSRRRHRWPTTTATVAFEYIKRTAAVWRCWGAVISAAVLVAYYWRRQRRRTAAI